MDHSNHRRRINRPRASHGLALLAAMLSMGALAGIAAGDGTSPVDTPGPYFDGGMPLVAVPLPAWVGDSWNGTAGTGERLPYLIGGIEDEASGTSSGMTNLYTFLVTIVNPSLADVNLSGTGAHIFSVVAATSEGTPAWSSPGGVAPSGARPWTVVVPPLSSMFLGTAEKKDLPSGSYIASYAVEGRDLASERIAIDLDYRCDWWSCSMSSSVGPAGSTVPAAAAAGAGTAIAVTTVLAFATEAGRYAALTPLIGGYTRLRRRHLLDQYTRGRLQGYVVANPGASIAKIRGDLRLANGTTLYHLHLLEKEGLVVSRRDVLRRRFYPADSGTPENLRTLSVTQGLILDLIRDVPGIRQKEIAARAGTSPQVVSYHVLVLERANLIEAEHEKGEKRLRLRDDRIAPTGDGGYRTTDGAVLRVETPG